MLAQQGEAGEIMVEPHALFPFDDIVACAAFGAEAFLMRVILRMAADAFHGRFDLFRGGLVTRIAFNRAVRTDERKARHFVMIERRIGPGIGVVAILTRAPVVARVAIVLLVAGVAGRFRLWLRIARTMASSAGDGGVFSGKWERGVLIMVE